MWPELTSISWRPGLTSVWRLCSIRSDLILKNCRMRLSWMLMGLLHKSCSGTVALGPLLRNGCSGTVTLGR